MNRLKNFGIGLFFATMVFISSSAYSSNWKSIQLTDRQVENLEAFSNIYGFIRYFYPSKNLQNFDWDRFLMYGVDKILQNEDEDCANLMYRLFLPVCPKIEFQKEPFSDFENNIHAPFYKQEHHHIGEFTKLFYGKKYTPIKLVNEAGEYLQYYTCQLQKEVYIKFPVAEKKLPTKTAEYKSLEKELKKIEFRGTKWGQLISKKSRANMDLVIFQFTFRIADIINRWQIIHNFYANYEEDSLSETWNNLCKEAIQTVASCNNWLEYNDAIRMLFSNIHDSHVTVWPSFKLGGVGMYLSSYYPELQIDFTGDICYIAESGIYSEHLHRGDVITMVDSMLINEYVAERLKYTFYSTKAGGLNSLTGDNNLFQSYDRGKVFKLQIEKADGSIEEIEIKADRTTPYQVIPTNDFIQKYENNIIYINFCSRSATYKNFLNRISDFQQAKGVIMDVRGYPSPDDVLSIISHFIKDTVSIGNLLKPIISFPNRENIRYVEAEKWKIAPATSDLSKTFSKKYEYKTPLAIAIDVPIVFLTDVNAMSFAESFLEIVKHYEIGTIIGEPTAGCNGDATRIMRPFGTYLFTFNKFKNRDGSRFHGIGIQPDILSVPDLSDIRLRIDTQLERAKNYLYENRK